ncbi:fibrinogen alpha chain isoform X2 [Cynoglossus semilaevis]|nr:fibrinogen alpha chain-like isoform X2 [Cynoglossus semilaevis]
MQGLISHSEHKTQRRIRKVCETVKELQNKAETSMTAVTNIYNWNRRVIVHRYVSEQKFAEQAEILAKNLTLLRKRSSVLSQKLQEMRSHVKRQIEDLYRTEVDIDIKIRSCGGSCHSGIQFSVDHHSYQRLQTDMDQIHTTVNWRSRAVTPSEGVARVTLRPVDVGPPPSPEYKTIPTVQRELLTQFEDIEQNQFVLEEEVHL